MSASSSSSEINRRSVPVLVATILGCMFSGALIAQTAIAVFVSAIALDYGWSHASIGGAITMIYIGMAISAPLSGQVVDRRGPRFILLPLTFLSGLFLCTISASNGSLPSFYAAHFLLGLCQPGAVTYSKLISAWFARHRGVALTATGVGVSIAQIVVPPIVRRLMQEIGWGHAYLAFGCVEMLFCFPLLLMFFKEPEAGSPGGVAPLSAPLESGSEAAFGVTRIRVASAMRGRTYWHIAISQGAILFAFIGITTHAVGIFESHGVGSSVAVWGLSVCAVGGLVAQVVAGHLLDRFDTPRVILPFAVLSLAGLVLLQFAHGEVPMLAGIFIFGIGCSASAPLSYLTSRYYGVRNLSSIYGSMFPIVLLMGASAPVLVGAIFDRTRTYDMSIMLAEIAVLASIYSFVRLGPYVFSVKGK